MRALPSARSSALPVASGCVMQSALSFFTSAASLASSVGLAGSIFARSRSPVEHSLCRYVSIEFAAFTVRLTRSLRAGVLRRAVSLWSRFAASVFRATITPQSSGGKVVFGIANASVVAFSAQRPNPSVERTSNSGLRPLSAAAHVKR